MSRCLQILVKGLTLQEPPVLINYDRLVLLPWFLSLSSSIKTKNEVQYQIQRRATSVVDKCPCAGRVDPASLYFSRRNIEESRKSSAELSEVLPEAIIKTLRASAT